MTGNDTLPTVTEVDDAGDGLEMGEEVEVGVEQEQVGEEQHLVERRKRDREVGNDRMETIQGGMQVQEEVEVEQEGVELVKEVEVEQEGVEVKVTKLQPLERALRQLQEEEQGTAIHYDARLSTHKRRSGKKKEPVQQQAASSVMQYQVQEWEPVPMPIVLELPTMSKQQVQRNEEQQLDTVCGEPPHLKAQRGPYSLPTLRRTTAASNQKLAAPSISDMPTASRAPGEEAQHGPGEEAPPSLKTTSRSSQASTPAQNKWSLFEPIMESNIQSIKKSQRKKAGRLRIKRLSELKKANQLHTTAGQGDETLPKQSAASDVAQQHQSYTFSNPAAIVSSSKPIGGTLETKNPTPSLPSKEFVFSPPMTRSRLRRLQGTGSRDNSFVSQTSVTTPISSTR